MNEEFLRYTELLNFRAVKFLSLYGISPNGVNIDHVAMGDVAKCFFSDMSRIMANHNIERPDAHKVSAYTAYWIVKLKPLSVADERLYGGLSELCLYINELFAIYMSAGWLVSDTALANIRYSKSFLSSFLYTLKYRVTTGDNLAIMFYLLEQGQV